MSGACKPPTPAMMGRIGGEGRSEGRGSITWTIIRSAEDTEATQLSGVVRWRENIESTRIHTIALMCKMEGEEIFLLAELHPCHTKSSYHSLLTL